MKNGTFQFAVLNSCGNPVTATAVPKPTPPPTPPPTPTPPPPTPSPQVESLTCQELNLTPGTPDSQGNNTYAIDATAFPENVTISGFNFTIQPGDISRPVSTSSDSANITYTFAPGSYTVTAYVSGTGSNGEQFNNVTSDNCSRSFTVPPVQVASSLVCDTITQKQATANSQGDIPFTFTANATPNQATINSYDFTIQPGNISQPVNTSANSASFSYTLAPGNYTVAVTVNGTLQNGSSTQVTSSGCNIQVSVPTPPQTCTTASGQTYPEGSAQCIVTTSVTTPTTSLPNTGPGDVAGLFSGASLSGAGVHRIFMNRRSRRILKR